MTPQRTRVALTRRILSSLARRLDRQALDQLRNVAADQAVLIEQLQEQVAALDDAAECWRDDALRAMRELAELRGHVVAMVPSGHLVTVPTAQVSA